MGNLALASPKPLFYNLGLERRGLRIENSETWTYNRRYGKGSHAIRVEFSRGST